jgi:glycosyltransferase involved in cell wall biosynthesis
MDRTIQRIEIEMKVSIIICTCNRAKSLKRTLESIETMFIPRNLLWELIIVDNNSQDNTRMTVEDFEINTGLNVVYVFEEKKGLANARNRGIREAKGEIIAFTDDDCIVDKFWLFNISKEFDLDGSLSLIGGRVELYDQNDRPVSIRTFKERSLFLSTSQLFTLIMGSNMSFKYKVIDVIGAFDQNFGAGTRIKAAEDSDFLYRAYKMGFRLVYSPDVLVYHNHGRKTSEQVRILNKGYAIGRGGFYCKYILRGDQEIMKMALYEIFSLVKRSMKTLLRSKPAVKPGLILRAIALGFIYRVMVEFRNLKGAG